MTHLILWLGGLALAASVAPALPQQSVPEISDILAASEYLDDGDIPVDATTMSGKTPVYVAPNGSDANTGLDINHPKQHMRAAIQHANQHPATPFVIYLRGGIHYESAAYDYLYIQRGNLVIAAYPGEEAVVRPSFWPGNPSDWGQQHLFNIAGPYENITVSDLALQGWQEPFYIGSQYAQAPLRNIVIRNIRANEFRKRFPESLSVFFSTAYVDRDFFTGPAEFDPAAPGIKYQIEGLVISNVAVEGANLAVNIGDERDANVKGLRISNLELWNDPQNGNNTASDGIAVVNSYKVLIDSSRIENVEGDGIDCKAFDVCVVNSCVRGAVRNGVKFWRNAELVNSIVYAATPIDDGAVVIEAGPCRVVHSLLMGKIVGYAGGFSYDTPSTAAFEIVNSVFSGLGKTFYVGTSDLRSKNSLYHRMPEGLFSGTAAAANVAQLNGIANCSGNVSAAPGFTNVPEHFNQAAADGTTSMIEVYDRSALGETYEVGDIIEINDDGIARSITSVTAGLVYYDATFKIAFTPALASPGLRLDRCLFWHERADVSEDFMIGASSPCRDAGATAGVLLPSFDYFGNPRSMGPAPDIGPCEYSPYAAGLDSDGDGLGDAEEDADLDGVLNPGETAPDLPDTDGDGLSDLVEVRCGGDPRDANARPAFIRIDFQPPSSSPASGHCPAAGEEYGPRGYGWR